MSTTPTRKFPAMLNEGVDHDRLTRKLAAVRETSERFLGYPMNLDFTTIDNASIQYEVTTFVAIPEPSSASLLGLGGLALILRRRK